MEDPTYSEPIVCGHCGNKSAMLLAKTHNQMQEVFDDKGQSHGSAGDIYELLECPSCRGVTLSRYAWADWYDSPEDTTRYQIYPCEEDSTGMPPSVKKAYEAAKRVRAIDANAYGVLLGRLLEMICDDQKAPDGKLANRMKELCKRGIVPQRLVDAAVKLIGLRDVGAHAALGNLTASEVPIAQALARAVVEYVYKAPTLIAQAEAAQKALKRRRVKKQKSRPASQRQPGRKTEQ